MNEHVVEPDPYGAVARDRPVRDWGWWAAVPLLTGLGWMVLWLPVGVLVVTSAIGDDLHCRPGQVCGGRDLADLDAAWEHLLTVGSIGWLGLWAVPPVRGQRARSVLRATQVTLALVLTSYLIAAGFTYRA